MISEDLERARKAVDRRLTYNPELRRVRGLVRWFLLAATREHLESELAASLAQEDHFRAACVRELIAESAD